MGFLGIYEQILNQILCHTFDCVMLREIVNADELQTYITQFS